MAQDTDIVKCNNYILCKTKLPEWWYSCKGQWLCTNCDIDFGKWQGGKGTLIIKDNVECPICLETKKGISLPKCDHYICIGCFKRCYFNHDNDSDSDDDNKEAYLRKCPLCRL